MLTVDNARTLSIGLTMEQHGPPGNPLYYITSNGEALHPRCVREVIGAHPDLGRWSKPCPPVGGRTIIGSSINWEDPDLHCAYCGEAIALASV